MIAVLYVLGIGIAICSLQTNSIANAFTGVVKINPLIPGIVVTVLAYLVNIGGMKRLADASSIIVPFMVVTYFVVVTFIITTIIVCTLTAMAILMTGSLSSGQDGILLLQTAFYSVLRFFGSWMIFLAMFLFGFTTLLADMHYGEANLPYIFGDKAKVPFCSSYPV